METTRPSKKEIGENIKAVRKSCGLTQVELSEIIGVNRSRLASWEAGFNEAPATIYKQILDLVPT